MQEIRNCDGRGNQSFAVNVFGEVYTRCPLSFLDDGCIEVTNIVNMTTGGMGGISALPSQLLEETAFFFTVHSLINQVDGEIERMKKERKHDG